MYKLRTIDVWDTLIRRTVHPETIKLATARAVFVSYAAYLKPGLKSHWELYHQRLAAEKAIADAARLAGWDDEYELTNVVHHWLGSVFVEGAVTDDIATAVAEFELTQEMSASYADPTIRDFIVQYPAERTLFLSDFYMSADFLSRLLEHLGLQDVVPEGIVSCEYRLNKKSGRLFQKVHETLGISPDEHVHIGDNAWSDVEMPASLGIAVAHFEPAAEHGLRQEAAKLFPNRQALFDVVAGRIDDALTADMPSGANAASVMERLGVRAAPLFVGFALFIAEQALRDPMDRMFFLTREGEFFRRVYETLFPGNRYSGQLLPVHDLLVASRLSTFRGSISPLTLEDVSRMWKLQGMQTPGGIAALLGVSGPVLEAALAAADLRANEVIERPENDSRIRKLFLDPPFLDLAAASVERSRQLMIDYMVNAGIEPDQRVAIIDIGWRGTILDNIARVLTDTTFVGLYLGLRDFVNPQPANVTKRAFGPDERVDADVREFFTTFEPLELLCNSASGSAVEYVRDAEGRPSVVRALHDGENATFETYTRHFQNGVLRAAEHWASYIDRHAISSDELRAYAENIWLQIAKMPPEELVQAYYDMPKVDTFALSENTSTSHNPAMSDILLAAIDKQRRAKVIHYIKSTQWSASIKSARGLNPVHKAALLGLYWLAHRFKAVTMWKRRQAKLKK